MLLRRCARPAVGRRPRERRDRRHGARESRARAPERTETTPAGRTRAAWSCPRCPAGWREYRLASDWDVRRTPAHRLEAFVGAAVREVRRPTRLVLEQADGADVAISAEIKPVPRAFGHADEIARFDLDGDDRTLARM